MAHDFMMFISICAGFWLAEFLVLLGIRIWQVRGEIFKWFSIGPSRRRVNALMLGMFAFMTFAVLQRGKATHAWFTNAWNNADTFTVVYHMGLFGLLGMLWWAFQSITDNRGGKYWIWSVVTGFWLGIAVVLGYH